MICVTCGAVLTSPLGVSLTVCPFCNTEAGVEEQAAAITGVYALRTEYLRRGESLYTDKRVLDALLGDLFFEKPKLLKILRLAVQENLAPKIASLPSLGAREQQTQLSLIVACLADEYSMSKARAADAVRVLAFGAGIADEVVSALASTLESLPQAGGLYPFGGHDWRVLTVYGSQALLLSDKILEKRVYHDGEAAVGWTRSALRQYLNSDFYYQFPATDRNRIAPRTIRNNGSPWFGANDVVDTSDRIFLLSIEEAATHLGDANLSRPKMRAEEKKFWDVDIFSGAGVSDWFTQHGYPESSFFIDFQGNPKRIANDAADTACWWWLRTPGSDNSRAAYVHHDGSIDVRGYDYLSNRSVVGGVRPALWLNF